MGLDRNIGSDRGRVRVAPKAIHRPVLSLDGLHDPAVAHADGQRGGHGPAKAPTSRSDHVGNLRASNSRKTFRLAREQNDLGRPTDFTEHSIECGETLRV